MENRTSFHFCEESLVTEKEVEEKFKVMSGSAFDILIQSSEKQQNEFSALINKARVIESNAKKYFSTAVLQKKILTGIAKELKIPYHEHLLDEIEESEAKKQEAFLNLIKQVQKEQKEQVKNKIIFERAILKSIEEKREPIREKIENFKNALIDVWFKIIKEYQDNFKESPDEKYSPAFLQKLTLARNETLSHVVDLTNEILNEAYQSKDRNMLLNIAKKQLGELGNNWRGYFRLETSGFYNYLRALRLTQTEHEMLNLTMDALEDEYKKIIVEHDGLLLKIIQESLIPLQAQSVEATKNIANYSNILKQELYVGVHSLSGPSEKSYKHIASRNANLKIQNSEAKTHGIAQIAALNQVQIAYENGIQMAKQRDQKEFEQQEKMAVDALLTAKDKMEKTNECLKTLQNLARTNRKDLEYAKEYYDGDCHRVLDAQFAREEKKIEKRKASYLSTQKQYNAARVLPKALKIYGEVIFRCAEMKEQMFELNAQLKNNILQGQAIWTDYFEALSLSYQQKTDNFSLQKNRVEEGVAHFRETLAKGQQTTATLTALKNSLEEKLRDARQEFSKDLHEEHQEIFDLTHMQYADLLKQEALSNQVADSIANIENAMMQYASILNRLASIREKVLAGKEILLTMQARVARLEKMYQEALALASIGVKHNQLKMKALEQYTEAKKVLLETLQMLKEAGDERLIEKKALNSAKLQFSKEMHARPEACFDELSRVFSEVVKVKKSAEVAYGSVQTLPQEFDEVFAKAERLYQQKMLAGQMRRLMLDAILNNLHLWHIGKWGGGLDYRFGGRTYRIPHGVWHLITALSSVTDNKESLAKAQVLANERIVMGRTQWKYRFFNIRDDETTGVLYHAIRSIHLTDHLTEKAVHSLQNSLQKIKGLQLVPPQRVARAL